MCFIVTIACEEAEDSQMTDIRQTLESKYIVLFYPATKD